MSEADFLLIITPFRDKIFRIARRLLISIEEAEDATQEVVLKLWKYRKRFANYISPEAYAVTMTKNWCLDRLKSKQAQNVNIVHNNYEDHSQSLHKWIEVKDSLCWLDVHMERLPLQQKLVLQLRDIECFEFHEISKMLDMNQTAVRISLYRARKTMREKLTETHNYGIK